MNMGLFYGSSTCYTEMAAEKIRDIIGPELVTLHNLKDDSPKLMEQYDVLILGIPTWDFGEIQEDWEAVWDHFSFEEHCIHYRKIIDSADGLPMVVYNIPALSGVRFSLDQINELVTIPRVCALKQTSGDLFQMEQIKRNHPELVLYNGYDEIFASGLIAGADGGIGSTYNIMGWRYLEIFEAVKNNDVIKAKEMQVACNQVIDTLIQSGVLAGIKTLLYYMGIINTPVCRSPFSPVKEKNLDVLSKLAERLFEEHDRNKKMKII